MPYAAKRPCAHVGCSALASGSSHCAKHASEAARAARNFDRYRGSAASRGYDRAWQRFRLWFLDRHPFCEDCREEGRLRPATEPHHLKKVAEYPELRLVEENLRALCHDHHSARTARGE